MFKIVRNAFNRVEPGLINVYRRITEPRPPNLRGDRDIEYSWISAMMPEGSGRGLDFGCGWGYLSMVAVRRGFQMTAVDLTPVSWFYSHPHLDFVRDDIFHLNVAAESLDLVINCSAIEHVGLGRYGDLRNEDGDIQAMRVLHRLLRRGGVMLLTIPVGRDLAIAPLHRVYGANRLPSLLEGFTVRKQEFWIKSTNNVWVQADEPDALSASASATYYGLGCFVLAKNDRADVDREG